MKLESPIIIILVLMTLLVTGCPSGEEVATERLIEPGIPDKESAVLTENLSENANIRTLSSNDQGITALMYHRFGDDRFPSTSIGLEAFESHLAYLRENNYKVLTFGEAYERLEKENLDGGPFATITVDDGYRSFYNEAIPLLEEYEFDATLFVNTETVGGGSYMSWDQIKEVKEKGIEIGNHSHSHGHFLNRKDNQTRKKAFGDDLETAMNAFERHLNYQPKVYAYPYGEYIEEFKDVLKENGFVASAAQHSGVWHQKSDHFAVPRFPMNEFFGTMERFRDKMSMNPLRVHEERPENSIVSNNPPKLELTITDKTLNPNSFQCFIAGSAQNCDFNIDKKEGKIELSAQAKEKLTARRTNYTITAMSSETNNWHWYTKLWIRPEVPE